MFNLYIIESRSEYDLATCKREACYTNCKNYYSRIGAKDFSKIVKILDNATEVKCNDN